MSYIFKENWCNKNNFREANRTVDDIDYIVIHYTGNDGDSDENNGNYFKNNSVGASAHYFVDSDSVTRSVADKNIAWHCGDDVYYHKYCRNSNSIGIEICDDNYNGSIYPSAKTIENTILLTQRLMEKYKIPKENVIRHWDVSHKICPAFWCGSTEKDKRWKSEFWNKLDNSKVPSAPVSSPENNTDNNEIKAVQKWLNSNYNTGLDEDSIYGALTKKALVKALQTELNRQCSARLDVDGIFGTKTKSAIRNLCIGSKGNLTKVLQGFLICNGYDTNGFDGIFGNATESAVKSYQKREDLAVDGIAGKDTFSNLCC
ncbi:MAG: N-acetylmuramoyl-L-alanine amidase [Ruminococcus sp.]|nr:N-acetylmuramoyl-L-alanine amidase [Ruminococcus sp.]